MPQALADRPEISDHLGFVWRAYAMLRTDRQVGLDRGPIMFFSIDAYAQRYGVGHKIFLIEPDEDEGETFTPFSVTVTDTDEFDRFVALIRAMDEAERTFKAG